MENVTPFKPKTKRFSNPDATGQSPDENLSSQSGTENWLNSSRQSGLGQSWNPPGDHGDVDSLARWGFGQQQPMVDISKPPPKIDQTKAKSQILKHLNNSVMLPPTVVGFQSENQLSPTAASPSSTVVPSPILNNSQPSFPGGGENNRQGRPILGRKYEPNGGKPHEPSYSHTDYQMFNPDTAMAASVNPISQLATGKSALNATAAEFVPRSFQPVVDPSDNQPGEIGHWSNGDWPTNVPDSISTTLAETNFFPETGGTEDNYGAEGIQDITDAIINDVQNNVQKLRVDPGSFDVIKLSIQESFYAIIESADQPSEKMKILVELIVLPALEEDNFAYSCARLCSFLSENVFLNEKDKIFRRHLMQRLKSEHDDLQEFLENSDKFHLTNYAFFMAELYLQLQIEGERFEKFQDALIEIVNGLFSKPNDTNLNLAGRLLKVCGGALLEDELYRGTNKLEGVMKMCQMFSVSGTVSNSTRAILLQVMQIKPSCRETLSTEAAGIIANNNFPSEDAPVFFGPDGVPLTEEELNFLEENFVSTAAKDQQFYEDPDEDEIDEAYEEFLRSQQQPK